MGEGESHAVKIKRGGEGGGKLRKNIIIRAMEKKKSGVKKREGEGEGAVEERKELCLLERGEKRAALRAPAGALRLG